MRYLLLGTAVALAAFGAVSLTASGAVGLLWPLLRRRFDALPPAARAARVGLLRMAPTLAGSLVVLALVIPAWVLYEPRNTNEVVAPLLGGVAAVGFLVAGAFLIRLAVASVRTHRLLRAWTLAAKPVGRPAGIPPTYRLEVDYPVVALAGVRRPRLFLAGVVLDRCEPRQVAAMVAHELGHHRAHDNIRRQFLFACADALTWSGTGREMLERWERAAEEAADEAAVASGQARPADLAGALVAVARLAPSGDWPALPLASFYAGEDLALRVRRLLAAVPPSPGASHRLLRRAAMVALGLGCLVASIELAAPVHRAIELVVGATLP